MPPALTPDPFWLWLNFVIGLICVSAFLLLSAYTYQRRRNVQAAGWYSLMALCEAAMITFYTLEMVSPNRDWAMTVSKLQYIGPLLSPIWLIFTLEFAGYNHLLHGRRKLLLFIFPCLVTLLALTNEWHGLIWQQFNLTYTPYFALVKAEYGLIYYLNLIHYIIILGGGCAFLIFYFPHRQSLYRSQRIAWIIGTTIPLLGSTFQASGGLFFPQIHPVPILYLAGALIVAYAVFQRQFFTTMPIAYTSVFDNLPDALITLDANECITTLNTAAKMQFVLDDRMLGQQWSEVVRRCFPQHPTLITHAQGEFRIGERTFQLQNAPLMDGYRRQRGRTLILSDITVFQRLRELEAFKSDMLNMAAHDLKNPLTVVLCYTELLKESITEGDDAELLNGVDRSAQRMLQIIQDFLSLERIERLAEAPLTLPVSLKVLAERALAEYLPQAEAKQIRLAFSPTSAVVFGDEAQLYEVMSNLIQNALKYTLRGGEVDVSLSVRDGRCIFEVVDTGVGVPVEQQARLFQPFYRAARADIEAIEGSGLGLHLVKNIVERHHGQIIFYSEVGQGSTFGFALPLASAAVGEQISVDTVSVMRPGERAFTPGNGLVAAQSRG